ncbi:MAG: hypothetical protein H6696_00105 [Deferribacteres bacterium]|nr:hypothetical protein [candidate division KSB1 bacterium]MCB9500307.1 hypothetical protein [Deferribacteres bacterium]
MQNRNKTISLNKSNTAAKAVALNGELVSLSVLFSLSLIIGPIINIITVSIVGIIISPVILHIIGILLISLIIVSL